jgi:hypothetical protein
VSNNKKTRCASTIIVNTAKDSNNIPVIKTPVTTKKDFSLFTKTAPRGNMPYTKTRMTCHHQKLVIEINEADQQ